MKANLVIITLAVSAFALISCKPKAQTTEEKVSAGTEKITEGINEIIETQVDEAEPAEAGPADAPAQGNGTAAEGQLEQAPAKSGPQ